MSCVSAMSDLSEIFHYIFICPIIYIALAEFINFLPQTVCTKLWETWEHFRGNVLGEISGNVIFAIWSADKVSAFILGVMKSLCFIVYSVIQELIKLHRRDNVTLGGFNSLMNVSRLTDGCNENQDSRQRVSIPDIREFPSQSTASIPDIREFPSQSTASIPDIREFPLQSTASVPDEYLRKLRSGRVYDITLLSNTQPTKPSGGKPQNGRPAPGSCISFRGNRSLENWFGDNLSQEERSPDHNLYIQRYARPSSLLTSSRSPVALANNLSPQIVKKSPTVKSAKKK